MKLSELGLKQKPETKYVAGGWVSFSTLDKELYYEVIRMTKTNKASIDGGIVMNKEHLDQLLTCKSIQEYVQA